jgi:hypothetical protein
MPAQLNENRRDPARSFHRFGAIVGARRSVLLKSGGVRL